jgi:hypothetical protein
MLITDLEKFYTFIDLLRSAGVSFRVTTVELGHCVELIGDPFTTAEEFYRLLMPER